MRLNTGPLPSSPPCHFSAHHNAPAQHTSAPSQLTTAFLRLECSRAGTRYVLKRRVGRWEGGIEGKARKPWPFNSFLMLPAQVLLS